MNINRGKQFEKVIQIAFERVPGVSIDRLHDQTTGYKGSQNIADFIVYKKPYELYLECKSVHGNTFPLSNITITQWDGLLAKSKIDGVIAGVMCWWVDQDVTKYMPIQTLQKYALAGVKSIRYDEGGNDLFDVEATKKRIFFDYDMQELLERITR